jgi:tetratricopeptide (TPR) repeat protein
MRALGVAILVVGLCVSAHGQGEPASTTPRHLLAGVRAFKAGHYEDALVELRVVARAKDAPDDLAFYLGPTLYKLGRYQDALGVFLGSHAAPDTLTDFYLAQTYYRLALYRSARGVFADLRTRGLGPALDDAAARYIAEVDRGYEKAPEPVVVDVYVAQALALTDGRLAVAYLDEARQVEELLPVRHRTDEIAWELARRYAALGDARARALLEPIAAGGGPHASEAADMLAKLP